MYDRDELVDAMLAAEEAGDIEAAETYQQMIDDMDISFAWDQSFVPSHEA
jgi:hypothetical protein